MNYETVILSMLQHAYGGRFDMTGRRFSPKEYRFLFKCLESNQTITTLRLGVDFSLTKRRLYAKELRDMLNANTSLTSLDLSAETDEAQEGLAVLLSFFPGSPKWKHLNLRGHTGLWENQVAELHGVFALCSNLTSINLSRTGLNDTALATFALWLERHPHVVELDLSDNQVTAVGAATLLPCMPHNNSLNLSNNPLGADCALFSEHLRSNKTLTRLSMENCNIGAFQEWHAVWSALGENTTLKHLNISGNMLTPSSSEILADALTRNNVLLSISLATQCLPFILEGIHRNRSIEKFSILYDGDVSHDDVHLLFTALHAAWAPKRVQVRLEGTHNAGISKQAINVLYGQFNVPPVEEFSWKYGQLNNDILRSIVKEQCIFRPKQIRTSAAMVHGIKPLLKYCTTIRSLDLSMIFVNINTLLEALAGNKSITSLNMSSIKADLSSDYVFNPEVLWRLPDIWTSENCSKLSTWLMRNSTLLSLTLNRCILGNRGAFALADALKSNTTLQELHVESCFIEEVGIIALCAAAKWRNVHSTLQLLNISVNVHTGTSEYHKLLESPSCVRIKSDTRKAYFTDLPLLLSSCLRRDLDSIAVILPVVLHFKHIFGGSYCAVAAAMLNNVDLSLECMQEWPQYAAEVIKQRRDGNTLLRSGFGILRTIVYEARKDPATLDRKTAAIAAVTAVAEAIQSTKILNLINVHLCGEGYAGKTKTKLSLLETFNVGDWGARRLPSTLPVTVENERRTLGMDRTDVDCTGLDNEPVRVLIHDYGGQVEFRANHATHLRAANSVYVVVVPLWDLRPGASHNTQMDRKLILEHYKNWLRYIYTIASGTIDDAKKANATVPVIITVVNIFATRFNTHQSELKVILDDLNAAQISFNLEKERLHFVGSPILLDSIVPEVVRTKLVPEIKKVVIHFRGTRVSVAPCLATILADMERRNKWPMFSPIETLQKLIYDVLEPVHAPHKDVPVTGVRHKVLDTIATITKKMLDARRDVLILSVQDNNKISINNPNWLTQKLLGTLFDPAQRAYITKPISARADDAETHLLDVTKINAYVSTQLDQQSRDILQSDRQLIPHLLQHIGVCIPVAVEGEFLKSVAEGCDSDAVQHWFPAFSVTPMSVPESMVLLNADHIIAREFKLVDPEFSIFPHGYFSSLFVCIVSLYNVSNRIILRSDGMELKTSAAGAGNLQIIVRMMSDTKSFVVVVAALGTSTGGKLTFTVLNKIKQFIFSESDWRGAVRVKEHGIDPENPYDCIAIEIEELERRVCDPREREENLRFYIGVKRTRDVYVQEILESVMLLQIALTRVESALNSKLIPAVLNLRRQLMNLSVESLVAVRSMQERIDSILEFATNEAGERRADLQSLFTDISAIVLDATAEDRLSRIFHKSLADPMLAVSETLRVASALNIAELASIKDSLLGEMGKISEHLQDVSDVLLLNRDLMHTVASQLANRPDCTTQLTATDVQKLVSAEMSNLEKGLSKEHGDINDLLARLDEQICGTNEAQQQTLDQILTLRDQLVAVRTSQTNTTYDMYNLPLLASISKEAKVAPADDLIGNISRAYKKAKRKLYKPYRVQFICSVCGKKARCGDDGLGYEMLVTKQWVQNVATALRYTLFAIKVISLITPYALPHLDKLADYIPGGDAALKELDDTFKRVKDAVTTQTKGVELLTPEAVTEETPPASMGTAANRDAPKITLEHVAHVRSILQVIGETVPPRGTGLECVVRNEAGECAWVCCGENGTDSLCKKRYKRWGSACIGMKIVLG